MWSRLQTTAALEGGMLYAFYQLQIPSWDKRAIVITGSCLIGLVCSQMWNDRSAAVKHLRRMRKWEIMGTPFESNPQWRPFGGQLKATAMVFVNLINLLLVWRSFNLPA